MAGRRTLSDLDRDLLRTLEEIPDNGIARDPETGEPLKSYQVVRSYGQCLSSVKDHLRMRVARDTEVSRELARLDDIARRLEAVEQRRAREDIIAEYAENEAKRAASEKARDESRKENTRRIVFAGAGVAVGALVQLAIWIWS